MNISLNKLNDKGFIFHKYDKALINLEDRDQMVDNFETYINSLLPLPAESLIADFDMVNEAVGLEPHYHIIPGSFQVVIWLPQKDFEKRYFLYGTPNEVNQVKPELGYMCFMKPNDPNFIHGVNKHSVENSIETLAFSSLVQEIKGNQDIYINNFQLNPEVKQLSSLI